MNKHPMPTFLWLLLNHNGRLNVADRITHISLPMTILGNFDAHYALFDETGLVKYGARTFLEAMRIRKRTGLYVTRILD